MPIVLRVVVGHAARYCPAHSQQIARRAPDWQNQKRFESC